MAFVNSGRLKPFDKKVYLASPTMHGEELKYMTEAYETNWMSTVGANATIDCESEVGKGSTICCGATVVDNTYVEPQTEVKHGQICYGNKLAKKTPEGNNYCFEDGM